MEIKLKEFREKYKVSQKEVSEKIGIDQRQWSRYENEINELPIRYLKRICTEYKISADWLLGLKEE